MMFDESWSEIDSIIAYGYGHVGKKYIPIMNKIIKVEYIIDNGAEEKECEGINICKLNEVNLVDFENFKIVVFASRDSYKNIKERLEEEKLSENINFCQFDTFVMDWFWECRGQNCLREVHTSINTHCTLKCEKCNMFMSHYNETFEYKIEELKQDFDDFFTQIDFVFAFSLLGGEPFLNKDLLNILDYLYENYKDKIGVLEVISNGTIVPSEEMLKGIKKDEVFIRISDYTSEVDYSGKLERLCSELDSKKVKYSVEKSLVWTDFMFPDKTADIKDVRKHMLSCSPEFHGLNDGRFFYCHVAWSAEKCGLFELNSGDSIKLCDINSLDKNEGHKIIEHAKGNLDNGYLSLCKYCMGCGNDNMNYIKVGKQKR